MAIVFVGIDLAKNVFALHGTYWHSAGTPDESMEHGRVVRIWVRIEAPLQRR